MVVDATDGTFAIDGLAGYGRLVDGGDHGDTYNYSPPATDTVVDTPDSVTLAVGDRGPVRAPVVVTATYTWPERVDGDARRRVGSRTVEVTTTLELRADEAVIRVHTAFVNPSRDHRLRVHLPLPPAATTSQAECAFTVVERGLTAEGRPRSSASPPSRPAASCRPAASPWSTRACWSTSWWTWPTSGGDGLRPATLALTLLRATGMLSRLGMSTPSVARRPHDPGRRAPAAGPGRGPPTPSASTAPTPTGWPTTCWCPWPLVGSFGGGARAAAGTP